jgi:hypothetical protein
LSASVRLRSIGRRKRIIPRLRLRLTSSLGVITGGMAALLTGDPKTACDYFESGFAVARAKLLSIDPARQPTSMNLLWWLAYHCILAAKHAGRAAIVRKIADAIQAYLDNVREGAEDRLNAAAAREVYERAIRENLIASRKGAQA